MTKRRDYMDNITMNALNWKPQVKRIGTGAWARRKLVKSRIQLAIIDQDELAESLF
jgi:hypothetical protein